MNDEKAERALKRRSGKAKRLIKSEHKLDSFLVKLEKKISEIPRVGEKLSKAIVMISMLKSYTIKEYTDFPLNALISIVAALLYFLSPIDMLLDWIPIFGYVDDVAVIGFCWLAVEADIDKYIKWRNERA